MYIHVHDFIKLYMHVHDFIYLYVHGTCTFMYVNRCMDIVQTRLYSFTLATTLHLPSSLATPVSLSFAQEALFQVLSSLLPVISLFNWQTTQALLAMDKLPESLVYLIHIAATLAAIGCCIVTAAHLEASSPLVLAELVRNGRAWVTSQEQGD